MVQVNKILGSTIDTTQYKISNTVRSTTIRDLSASKWIKVYQFHAKYDGCISAYATLSSSSSKCEMYVMRSLHDYVNTSGSGIGENDTVKSMTHPSVYTAAVGSIFSSFFVPRSVYIVSGSNVYEDTNLIYGTNHYNWSSSSTYKGNIVLDTTIPVKKGEEVVFMAYCTTSIEYDTKNITEEEVVMIGRNIQCIDNRSERADSRYYYSKARRYQQPFFRCVFKRQW